MVRNHDQKIDPGMVVKEKKTGQAGEKSAVDDSCRCREVSEMKPGDLLRLMMSDLAFWKKPKKDKDGR